MGRAPCCDKANVKKGPWSPEEDAKLKFFIEQNGTGGNWITLPSKAGLKRCGKSCRLRWINYLRPDIKHGSFSQDEEKTIYRLHGQIGSRWSLIAAQLPGRTDNDIKNYWNTRLKKKLSERGNASHAHYGCLQPYQQQIPAHQGLQDQMATAAAREGLLHGQHSYSIINHLYPQQMQYLEHHQVVHDSNQTVQLPVVMKHQMLTPFVPHISNEMGHERRQQQTTVLARTNEAVNEAERLMVIESSLRNIIVRGEAATGSSCGGGDSRRSTVNNMGGTTSLLATPRFGESALLGDGRHPNLGVYHRSPRLSESEFHHSLPPPPPSPGGGGKEWWNLEFDLVSPDPPSFSRAGAMLPPSVKWPILSPRCGAEKIYTSLQTQLASQSHGPQPDGMNVRCSDTYFSKLIV